MHQGSRAHSPSSPIPTLIVHLDPTSNRLNPLDVRLCQDTHELLPGVVSGPCRIDLEVIALEVGMVANNFQGHFVRPVFNEQNPVLVVAVPWAEEYNV